MDSEEEGFDILGALERGDRIGYRLAEVSKLIGIPVSTLRSLIRRGEINPVTTFGTWLITAEDLEERLSKREKNL